MRRGEELLLDTGSVCRGSLFVTGIQEGLFRASSWPHCAAALSFRKCGLHVVGRTLDEGGNVVSLCVCVSVTAVRVRRSDQRNWGWKTQEPYWEYVFARGKL